MRNSSNNKLLVLVACLLLALGACVSDDDSGGDGDGGGGGGFLANNGILGANNGGSGGGGGDNNGATSNNGQTSTPTNNGATNSNNGQTSTPTNNGATNSNNGQTSQGGDCDVNGFEPAREQASAEQFGTQYISLNTTGTPYDALYVQIYTGFDGPTEPGTYSLDGINYADCGLCVLARQGCEPGAGACEKTFYAEKGSVEITSMGGVGGTFSARLIDVVMDEVTIDNQTYVSTPVAGGEDWCIGEYSFEQEVLDPAAALCDRSDINCIGETVPDFQLQNCETDEMVSMSDLAQNQKALWFVLTAGWCPACRQWLPQVHDLDDQYKDQGLEVVYILGEDANYGAPSTSYCRQYAGHYAPDASNFYIDHNGEYSFATTFANMWPYIDDNGAFGLPWNALVDPETFEYIHADGSSSGSLENNLNTLLSR